MTNEDWEALIAGEREGMVRFAWSRLRRGGLEYEAEDIVHDAFLKMKDKEIAPDLRRSYLTEAVKNLCRDRLGQLVRATERDAVALPGKEVEAYLEVARREALQFSVAQALDKLPDERSREIARMRYAEGWSVEEVARRLNIGVRTVKRISAEVLVILQKELAPYDPRGRRLASRDSQPPIQQGVVRQIQSAGETEAGAPSAAA